MNPETKNTNSSLKSVWYVISAIVVVILLVFAFKGGDDEVTPVTNTDTNDTRNTSGNNTGATGNTNTTGSNGTARSNGGNGLAGNVATSPTDAHITALMNVAKVRVPGVSAEIALSSGVGSYTTTGSNVKGTVQLGKILGKFTTTDGYDVLVVMNHTSTQSISSNHVVLFHVKDDSLLFTSSISIGNGVTIQSTTARSDTSVSQNTAPTIFNSAQGYKVTINYLERKGNEPAGTTPSSPKDLTASVKNHIISR